MFTVHIDDSNVFQLGGILFVQVNAYILNEALLLIISLVSRIFFGNCTLL